jgi:UDPglucose 6-dehydrogenase/GDP-mannose 6-dehydrogenase
MENILCGAALLIRCCFGRGYVGLVNAVFLAEKGHEVLCVDVRQEIVDKINRAMPTIHEPGLEELLKKNIGKRLQATTALKAAVLASDISFICVGTPSGEDGNIDLTYVKQVSGELAIAIREKTARHTVVVKSTVVPGTAMDVVTKTLEAVGLRFPGAFGIASNPEFLREGDAVHDFMNPDRIIIGAEDELTKKVLAAVYEGKFNAPLVFTNTRTAEMIKYANNALLATLISFSNEMANLCETVPGVDVDDVLKAVTMDGRINPKDKKGNFIDPQVITYLRAGCGYGGSCFPKDIAAIMNFARKNKHIPLLLDSVTKINKERPELIVRRLKKAKGSLNGKVVAVLGTAFKPDTDDIRESPAIALIELLLEEGAAVRITDPQAMENTEKIFGDKITYYKQPKEALTDSDIAILITKWKDFASLTPEDFKSLMKTPVLFDGRRLYDKKKYSTPVSSCG